jgi:hypothetical protein
MLVSRCCCRAISWSLTEPQTAGGNGRTRGGTDDHDPWAHLALGYGAFAMRRTDEAVAEFTRALELNPNCGGHGFLGLALSLDSDPSKRSCIWSRRSA